MSKRFCHGDMSLMWTFVIGALLSLVFGAKTFAECRAPHYRKGKVLVESPMALYSVSISPTDFVPEKLVCLAERLRRDHRREERYSVLIFSSHEAAMCYHGPSDHGDRDGPVSRCEYAPWSNHQFHGLYSYRFDSDTEFVSFNPLGGGLGGYILFRGETFIALPATTVPRCEFRVSERCVVSMDYPNPGVTQTDTAGGSVTLMARVTRRGVVEDVKIADVRGDNTQASQNGFVDAAISNLKTWRLETASHVDTIRISYVHVLDASLAPSQVDVEFDLPHQIVIRTW